MNKHLNLSITAAIMNYGEQIALDIHVARASLRDWRLGLCLLKEGLIECLIVSQQQNERAMKLQLLANAKKAIHEAIVRLESSISRVALTRKALDAVQSFFLKYYRDGISAVRHLDLQAEDDTGNTDVYVTMYVKDVQEPLTLEELKSRIDH